MSGARSQHALRCEIIATIFAIPFNRPCALDNVHKCLWRAAIIQVHPARKVQNSLKMWTVVLAHDLAHVAGAFVKVSVHLFTDGKSKAFANQLHV